jgi:hypothetical protein
MENINYSLSELDNQIVLENVVLENVDHFLYDIEQLTHYYNTYTVKNLSHILQYYGLQKNKMVKEEMIQVLLFFETDPLNKFTVEHRLRLWKNIQELKTDSYFSKYILF